MAIGSYSRISLGHMHVSSEFLDFVDARKLRFTRVMTLKRNKKNAIEAD